MPSSLKLESHLSLEELKQRYRNSYDAVERSHIISPGGHSRVPQH